MAPRDRIPPRPEVRRPPCERSRSAPVRCILPRRARRRRVRVQGGAGAAALAQRRRCHHPKKNFAFSETSLLFSLFPKKLKKRLSLSSPRLRIALSRTSIEKARENGAFRVLRKRTKVKSVLSLPREEKKKNRKWKEGVGVLAAEAGPSCGAIFVFSSVLFFFSFPLSTSIPPAAAARAARGRS